MAGTSKIAFEGEHEARIVHVVRAGRHESKYDKFNKGATPRLWVTFELLDDKNDDGKNRWISLCPYGEPINSYFTERGKQQELLAAAGFKENTEESLEACVGSPVWLEVTHYTNPKTGKTYANIAEYSKVRAKDAEGFDELGNPAVFFDIYAPAKESYMALPTWIRDYIKSAEDLDDLGLEATLKEWDAEALEAYKAANPQKQEGKPKPKAEPKHKREAETNVVDEPASDDFDDDIPF